MVDDAVLERESAQARSFARERRPVRPGAGRERGLASAHLPGWARRPLHRPEVVFGDSRPPFRLRVHHTEVFVEVAPERRGPREAPAHPPLVRLELLERRPRHRPEHHVVVGQVHGTWEGDESDLRRVDPETGEVL